MADWLNPTRPLSIAHRGASAYAPDCSLEAYEIAARLGADFWEVDIRRAACGTLITYHDDSLPTGERLSDLTAQDIALLACEQNAQAEPFETIAKLAFAKGAGIYADIKDLDAAVPTMKLLQKLGITKAILGGFSQDVARVLKEHDCPYPRSILVPSGVDPFEYSKGAEVMHLCWEDIENPEEILGPEFFAKIQKCEQKVVLWHEEDPQRMDMLRNLPVLGICSDCPELVNPFRPPADWPVDIVCHRGACEFAPENTLSAAQCAWAAGFSHVEIDLRETADGELVVFHDESLARTSSGRGAVSWRRLEQLQALDAGSHRSSFYALEPIPTFQQVLEMAKRYDGKLYVEIKSASPDKVLAEVQAADMLDACFFWSFDVAHLRSLARLCPSAPLMIRRQDFTTLQEALSWKPQIVEFDMQDDPSEIAMCQSAGARAMLAYSGKDAKKFAQISKLRPDMVNLHYPFLFRDYCNMIFYPNE